MQKKPEAAAARTPLTRERVLTSAMALADTNGISALTMRSLAQELGAKPMSLYHHVANKDEILDALVDLVFAEVELPSAEGNWRTEMTRRAGSLRTVLRRHPWAVGLLETRTTPGPATLRHHNATLGVLRVAGFSVVTAAHAYALLDSYIYGFALQEATLPINGPESVPDVAAAIAESFSPTELPYLYEMATKHVMQPGYDFGAEFSVGLELILNSLAEMLVARER